MPERKAVQTSIMNLDSGRMIILPIGPEIIRGNVSAKYNTNPAMGAASSELEYANTENEPITFDLRWERRSIGKDYLQTIGSPRNTRIITASNIDDLIDAHRAFVRSLVNPVKLAWGMIGGNTPLLVLNIPGVVQNWYCRMESINWDIARRDYRTGNIVSLKMTCTFKEDPRYKYTSEDIAEAGYRR